MPTYGYLCPSCGPFELFQGMKEAALEKCPKCGSPVKRQISGGAGFIFKGSGFYATDYRSGEYTRRENEDKAASGSKDGSSGGAGTKAPEGGKTTGDKATGDKAASGTPPAGGAGGSSAPAVGGGPEAPKPAPPSTGS